jgi:SSS family transporter
MTHFSWLDYTIFIAYLVGLVSVGVFFVKEQKNVKDYFLAGRSMGYIMIAISVLAALFSGISYLGAPGEVYRYGFWFMLFFLSFFIATPMTNLLFMPYFYNTRFYTAYQFLEERFSMQVRLLCSALFIIRVLLWLGLVNYAPALALNQVTGMPLWFTILCTGVLTTIYTTLGGMKAVIWTDFIQFFVLLGGQFIILIVAITHMPGGLSGAINIGREYGKFEFSLSPDLKTRVTLWGLLFGGAVINLVQMATDQVSVQRYMTATSIKEARRSLWFKLGMLAPVFLVFYGTGLVIFAFYHSPGVVDPLANGLISKPDQILPYFVVNELKWGLPGLLIAAIFGATMSATSSGINALTTATLVDFHQRFWHKSSDAEGVKLGLARALTFAYGMLVIILAFVVGKLGSLLEVSNTFIGMVGGPLLGIFFLGILVKRANTPGTVIGWLAGVLALIPICFFNTTYQVPLDWSSGTGASWQERSFAYPVTCNAVRLKVQQRSDGQRAGLAEWQVYELNPKPVEPVVLDVAAAFATNQVAVSGSSVDIRMIGYVFDGNTNTTVSLLSSNSMAVTLSFAQPKRLARSRVYLGSDSEWRVETANSAAELDAMTNIPFKWAKTSFMWYGVVGCLVTVFFGWIASELFSLLSTKSKRESQS